MRVIDYEIVSGHSYDYVVQHVKDGIRKGWQPHGSLAISAYGEENGDETVNYAQGMVLYDMSEDNE